MEGPIRKAEWAAHHGRTLRSLIEETERGHQPTITYEIIDERGTVNFRAHDLWIPDPELGLIFGDFVHSLRASLDHLVFELALTETGELSPEQQRQTAFPISSKASPLPSGAIALVSPEARERILELQPFHIGTEANHDSAAYARQVLARLNHWDIVDKHRTIHIVQTWHDSWAKGQIVPDAWGFEWSGRSRGEGIVDGEIFFRCRPAHPLTEPLPELDEEVLAAFFKFGLGLDYSVPPYATFCPMRSEIQYLTSTVGTILKMFQPSVETGQPPKPLPERSS